MVHSTHSCPWREPEWYYTLSCFLFSSLSWGVTSSAIVYEAPTSSILFSALHLIINSTSKKQICRDHFETGHLKTNDKLHAMAKEDCADFCIVTKPRTDSSKNSLEADKLIKAVLRKKYLYFAYIAKLQCVTSIINRHYYHSEQKEMYIYKDIYMCIILYSQRKLKNYVH